MDIYTHGDFVSMLSACYERGDKVVIDWLIDNGIDECKAWECVEPPTQSQFLPADYYGIGSGIGIGRGSGRGSGSGRGIGRGSGSGIGRGIGSGRGSGSGIGRGSGRGRGSGIGIGRGIGSAIGRGVIKMEPGKCYLIFTVDWFAWVGRMVRQIGPWEYEFESVSKFDTNAGDVFNEIAAGDMLLRRGCSYQHFKGVCIFGQGAVGKIPWAGNTPQEDGL